MRGRQVVRPAFLAALTALLLAPGLWVGPGFDAAVYTLAGVSIKNGLVPYRDIFDNKPPGLYLLNALGQMALPALDPWQVTWLLTALFSVATVLVLDRVLARLIPGAASFMLAVVGAIGIASHPIAYGGGLTESFAVLPLVTALWVLGRGASGWRAAGEVGFLSGVACLASVQAVPVAAVLTGAAIAADADAREAARRGAVAVASGALLPVLVVAWLGTRGALGDAVDQVATYNMSYRAASAGFGFVLAASLLILAGLAVPVGASLARMIHAPRTAGRVLWVCLAWVVSEVVMLAYENRLFLHYLIVLVPPLVVLCGPGMGVIVTTARSSVRRSRNIGILAGAVTAAMLVLSAGAVVGLTGITTAAAASEQAVTVQTSNWIKTNTATTATVFIWGNDTDILLVSGRPSYDRHVYQFPMVTAGYWTPAKTGEILADWAKSPPAVVVETPGTVALFRPNPDPPQPPNYDTLQPLRDFISSHYRLAASFGNGGDLEDIYVYAAAD
jgi:hypothetical protein